MANPVVIKESLKCKENDENKWFKIKSSIICIYKKKY